tara:strand:- start:1098 stop:1244 length:147 start_codon:yes stop_codon:yes gene_type:complete
MGKIFNAIANFFSYHHRRQQLVEDYLGTSTDLVDLERRQKDLARKGIY